MRQRILISLAVVFAAVVALWQARRLALVVDVIRPGRAESRPVLELAYSEGAFQIGDAYLPLHDQVPAGLLPEKGDEVVFTVRDGASWPTPLEFNFMTGHSPSWKQHRYYRLRWRKPSGASVDVEWRNERWFYSSLGWSGDQEGPAPRVTVSGAG